MVAASKVPILKPGEYDLWRMMMEQYIQMIDYSLWEVIENGNAPPITKVVEGVETTIALQLHEEKAQRTLELKARSTLLMGIPNEHQLKFNFIKDAKSLFSDVLNQTFDRLQKFISQLEIHGEKYLTRICESEVHKEVLMAMLTRVHNEILKNTGRKLTVNGNETIEFDKSKVECYNCHKRVHFTRECRAPRNQEKKNRENTRMVVPVERQLLHLSLVSCDGIFWIIMEVNKQNKVQQTMHSWLTLLQVLTLRYLLIQVVHHPVWKMLKFLKNKINSC
ncbi:ribonuclease H-like domain-containing protein [Tanacetum coccineum]